MARTKIVATLGPSSRDTATIRKMIALGVDVFRINFSHGNPEEYALTISRIREAAGENPVAILGDLSGPKIRCGTIAEGPVFLESSRPFILTARKVPGTSSIVSTNYSRLSRDVRKGERIFLDDGAIELVVEKIAGDDVHCRVINGGPLSSNKGINFPGTALSVSAPTTRDRAMIRFAVEQGLDFLALSFVKAPDDVVKAKKAIRRAGGNIPLISKIEKFEALDRLEAILDVSDGAMVARGDLGVEIALEEVPLAQKRIIASCNWRGIPVITATQMLQSMIVSPRPTRAEVADIANAICDGTDAVMLSGETASGQYPLEAVRIMNTIAETIEASGWTDSLGLQGDLVQAGSIPDAISMATTQIARALGTAAILCCSVTGSTARFVARYRPACPIIVFSHSPETLRRVNLCRGTIPCLMREVRECADAHGFDAIAKDSVEIALRKGLIKRGDRVVITAGLPLGVGGATNMLRVWEV